MYDLLDSQANAYTNLLNSILRVWLLMLSSPSSQSEPGKNLGIFSSSLQELPVMIFRTTKNFTLLLRDAQIGTTRNFTPLRRDAQIDIF